jgi:hypothetical protein
MKTIITPYHFLYVPRLFFSTTLSGKVVDEKGKPSGANVFIEGTYDGASTVETVILVLQPQPQANFGGEFLDL